MFFYRFLFLGFLVFFISLPAFASGEKFISNHERGWFWYEDPPVKEKPKLVKKVPKKATPAPKKLAKKKPVKKLAKKKEDPWELKPKAGVVQPLQLFFKNPAKNAKKYLTWLNKLSDRGMQMVASVDAELKKDPSLFPFTTPGATYASSQLKRMQSAEKDKVIEKYKGTFGVIVFLRADCKMCEIQTQPLNTAFLTGIDVLGITPDGLSVKGANFPIQADMGLAKEMGVSAVPATFLVDFKDHSHRLIRTGIMPYFDLELAIVGKLEEDGLWSQPERIEPWIKSDPRYKKLDRHGFNPFSVYQAMVKDNKNPEKVKHNSESATIARERIFKAKRVITQ